MSKRSSPTFPSNVSTNSFAAEGSSPPDATVFEPMLLPITGAVGAVDEITEVGCAETGLPAFDVLFQGADELIRILKEKVK